MIRTFSLSLSLPRFFLCSLCSCYFVLFFLRLSKSFLSSIYYLKGSPKIVATILRGKTFLFLSCSLPLSHFLPHFFSRYLTCPLGEELCLILRQDSSGERRRCFSHFIPLSPSLFHFSFSLRKTHSIQSCCWFTN